MLRELKNISWLSVRQIRKLVDVLVVKTIAEGGVIFDETDAPESAHVLLSGVARITCRNRKGKRALVVMVGPGMMPGFPPPANGINYGFQCEAVTECKIATVDLDTFIEVSLGIEAEHFKRMAANYLGRWNWVQLRCSNFMSCSLQERVALALLELSESFGVSDSPDELRLTVAARHIDIAELVGATRPRVTENVLDFERRGMIARRDRQMIVRRDQLETFLAQARSGLT
jgi:CRP-like cAMP-binding protein